MDNFTTDKTDIISKIDSFWYKFNERINEFKQRTHHENADDLTLQKALDSYDMDLGELPQSIERFERVCKADGSWQVYVRQIIQDMLSSKENQEILQKSIYGDLTQAKIYLSAIDEPNAFILKPSSSGDVKPPVIVFTKGVFFDKDGQKKPMDLLAYILGHELGHPTMTRWTNLERSSQFQETGADGIGVYLANNAGYSPNPFLSFWEERPQKDGFTRTDRVSGVHPISEDRLGFMRDVVGVLNAKKSISSPTSKLFFDADIEEIKKVYVPTTLEDLFQKTGYDKADENEKMQALIHIGHYLIKQRPDILESEMNLFIRKINALPKQYRQEIGKILSKDIINPTFTNASPEMIAINCLSDEIEADIINRRRFLLNPEHYTDEEIIRMSREIVAFHEEYLSTPDHTPMKYAHESELKESFRGYDSSGEKMACVYFGTEYFKLPEHQLADGKKVRALTWERILKCRDNASDEDRAAIDKALKLFDADGVLKKMKQIFTFQDDRYIIGLVNQKRFLHPVKSIDKVYALEAETVSNNSKAFAQRVNQIEWDLMEEDLPAFIERYKKDLMPDFSFIANDKTVSSHPIITTFTQKLSTLYDSDPAKYGPVIQDFYANILPACFDSFRQESGYNEWSSFYSPQDYGWAVPDIYFGSNNPYITFFKTPAGKELPLEIKVMFLANGCPFWQEDFNEKAMELLNITKPKTIDELDKLTRQFVSGKGFIVDRVEPIKKQFSKIQENISNSGIQTLNNLSRLRQSFFDMDKEKRFCARIARYITRNYLKEHQEEIIDFSKVPSLKYPFDADELYSPETHQVMERIVKRNMEHLLNDPLGLEPVAELRLLCDEYQRYNTFELHPYALGQAHGELDDKLAEKIITVMSGLRRKEDDQIFTIAKKLLQKAEPQYPPLRDYLIETIADIHALKIGKEPQNDSNEKDFYDKINAPEYIRIYPSSTAQEILCRIMNKCETQREVSYRVEDNIKNNLKHERSNELKILREGFRYLYESQDLNIDLLDFLTSPVTYKTTAKLLDNIRKKSNRDDAIIKSILNVRHGSEAFRSIFDVPDSVIEYALLNFHRFFWQQPEEVQSLLIKNILFKYHDKVSAKTLVDAFVKIKEKTIKNAQNADIQNLVLNTYFKQCGRSETRAFLVALLHIAEPPQAVPYHTDNSEVYATQKKRLGKQIGKILSKMGPAGGKLLQAIHSYPTTPEDIRADLKDSKSNFNPPKRYEIFHALDSITEKEGNALQSSIDRVGKLLGAGSFGYTVLTEQANENGEPSKYAVTLLRKNVEAEANEQFDRYFSPVINALAKHDSKAFGSMPAILAQARHLTAVEADFITGGKQVELAERMYQGFKVKTDGFTFKLKAAHLDSCGRGYKKTELAKGEHFNDLPEKTKNDRAFKVAAAKALFTAELYVLLQCGPIDSDRHGAQVRIDGKNITLFDHGAIDFKRVEQGKDENGHTIYSREAVLPSKSDKETLGQIIAKALTQSQHGKPFKDVLIEELQQAEQYPENKHFISTVGRSLLALGDYMNAMGDTAAEKLENLNACVSAVMNEKAGLDMTLLKSIAGHTSPEVLSQMGKVKIKAKPVYFTDEKVSFLQKAGLKIYETITAYENSDNALKRFVAARLQPIMKRVEQRFQEETEEEKKKAFYGISTLEMQKRDLKRQIQPVPHSDNKPDSQSSAQEGKKGTFNPTVFSVAHAR